MNQMKQNSNRGEGRALINGLATAVISAVILTLIAALIVTKTDLSPSIIRVISCFTWGVAGLFGGLASSKTAGINGLKNGALVGAVLVAALLIIGTIWCGFQFQTITVIKCIICILTGMIGGVWGVNIKAKRKMK